MSGDHEVNQTFFDGVRVPKSNRVGEENNGWTVAKYLLEFERGGSYAPRIQGLLRRVRTMASETVADDGQVLAHDPDFRQKLSDLEIAASAVDFTERRVIASLGVGRNVGDATASMLKLKGSETMQRVTELALEVLGPYAAPYQREIMLSQGGVVGPDFAAAPTAQYLNARASTIFGGSSEIQRNILSRVALGL